MTYIRKRNIVNKMSKVSVNPVKNETSAVALGTLEVAQLFASLLQVQLDKNVHKNEIREKLRRTIFKLQGSLIVRQNKIYS